ncbi:DUF3656 domain-containing U32 family peptidase [Haloferula sp.]|uniref:DUF3656 domain-containing U32 family peptidase n=1 Tax=Haloferula sp. TaxID=2497595 RepID=UPI00329F6434
MTEPELLSPAGNWDCARAAVAAGADAIYFGLPAFNARLRADNFTEQDLPDLMEFLHEHGVKGFIAMNTLIFTGELEAAERQLRLIAEAGVDALIIQDLGLAKMAREIAPSVELHASTQMTITSPEGLKFIESLFPLERAVLARELSVKEIERFGKTEHTPLEVFVHGALCVAYSGQCLTSESLGQRSANRGECAQACRMPYEIVVDGETRELGEVRYLLSPQDLAAVDIIPDLIKAGVKSYKIEGRLKTPEYVAAVTRVYRKALDAALEDNRGMTVPVMNPSGTSGMTVPVMNLSNVNKRQGSNLPHWSKDGATYAVTFRLHDSLPQTALKDYLGAKADAISVLKQAQLKDDHSLIRDAEKRLHEAFSNHLEKALEQGHGSCLLRDSKSSEIVENALKHFDGERYELYAWAVMPNHVHVIVKPLGENKLSEVLHSWKSFTAHTINKQLKREGDLWQDESYDHLIRNQKDHANQIAYILKHPTSVKGSIGNLPASEDHDRDGHATNPITDADRYALEMTFSRGLSSGWLAGTNHPYLTHGRFGKKRGPLLGTITEAQNGWIRLDVPPSEQNPPLKAGDGIVFDAGENRDLEQGARIWKVENDRIIFHRTFSGINFDRIRPGVTLYKTSDPALESEIRKFWQGAKLSPKKTPLHVTVTGKPGEPIGLKSGDTGVQSEAPLEPAAKRPLTTETLTKQLSRLGDTPYELASLDNQLEGDCHFPLSALNQLRRDLITAIGAPATAKTGTPTATTYRDLLPLTPDSEEQQPQLSVLTRTLDQVSAALACNASTIYCDFEDPRRYKDAVALVRATSSKIHLATPRILKPGENGYLKLIERSEPDGLLLRNLSSLEYYKHRCDFTKVADFSLNVANPITASLLKERAALDLLTVSYDLNISQVLELLALTPPEWFEISLHQHMPMFHMEHCVFCTFLSEGTTWKDCGRPCEKHVVHLRDRVGQLHRLQADVGCRNTLFNGRAQTGARFYEALRGTGLSRFRVELLDEDQPSAESTIQAYQRLLSGESRPSELLEDVTALEQLGVTEGTLKGGGL